MLRKTIQTIISWVKELWELLKAISQIAPPQPTTSYRNQYSTTTNTRRNALHDWRPSEPLSEVQRHRYIELEGYADNLRIDRLGRYDLNQIAKLAENFVYVSTEAIEDFIDETINYKCSIIDNAEVLWVPKGDCIEWAYNQYSALADLL